MLTTLLVLNALWFFGGFHTFYIRRKIFAKILVPKEERDTTAFGVVVETGRFMGGFNFALSIFNLCLFLNIAGLETNAQLSLMLIFNALAHGSQFFGNVPMALKNRKGGGLWNVFTGVMLQIFIIDFVLMSLNATLAFMLLL